MASYLVFLFSSQNNNFFECKEFLLDMNDQISDFPRPGSAEYNLLFGDSESQAKTLKTWKRLNKNTSLSLYIEQIFSLYLVLEKSSYSFILKEEKQVREGLFQ